MTTVERMLDTALLTAAPTPIAWSLVCAATHMTTPMWCAGLAVIAAAIVAIVCLEILVETAPKTLARG